MPPLLNIAECPICKSPAVFLWSDGSRAMCGRCQVKRGNSASDDQTWRVILDAVHTPDGNWIPGANIKFPELRQYIDDCLHNDHRRYNQEILTADATAIESLIASLASLLPPTPFRNRHAEQVRTCEQILEIRERSIKRLSRDLGRFKRGELILIDPSDVRRVQWRILAPDGHTQNDIERYCHRMIKQRSHRFDAKRLNLIYEHAKPDELYEGIDSFEGYLVFVYGQPNKAVLECGEVGNALFIVQADRWRILSYVSKTELLTWYIDEIKSYTHQGLWTRNTVKQVLERAGIQQCVS